MSAPATNPYLPPLSEAEPLRLKDPRALGLLACWFYVGSMISLRMAFESEMIPPLGVVDHVLLGIEVLATVVSVILVMNITRAQSALARAA